MHLGERQVENFVGEVANDKLCSFVGETYALWFLVDVPSVQHPDMLEGEIFIIAMKDDADSTMEE